MTVARGGRLPDAIDAAMERLNTSVDIDWELWREDVAGSVAHAEGLAHAGVLTQHEALSIVTGLQQIKGEIERGELVWDRKKEGLAQESVITMPMYPLARERAITMTRFV